MVNRANQAGIVTVTDGIEMSAMPNQARCWRVASKSWAFHNAATDKNGLRIEDMDEVKGHGPGH